MAETNTIDYKAGYKLIQGDIIVFDNKLVTLVRLLKTDKIARGKYSLVWLCADGTIQTLVEKNTYCVMK